MQGGQHLVRERVPPGHDLPFHRARSRPNRITRTPLNNSPLRRHDPPGSYGIGQGLDGREAAMKATQKALDQLGALSPVAGDCLCLRGVSTSPRPPSGLAGLLGRYPAVGDQHGAPAGRGCANSRARWWWCCSPAATSRPRCTGGPVLPPTARKRPARWCARCAASWSCPRPSCWPRTGSTATWRPICTGLTDLPCQCRRLPGLGRIYLRARPTCLAKTQSGPGGLASGRPGRALPPGHRRRRTAGGHRPAASPSPARGMCGCRPWTAARQPKCTRATSATARANGPYPPLQRPGAPVSPGDRDVCRQILSCCCARRCAWRWTAACA